VKALTWHRITGGGAGWIRLFGVGVAWRDTDRFDLLFVEREARGVELRGGSGPRRYRRRWGVVFGRDFLGLMLGRWFVRTAPVKRRRVTKSAS
jgi:hypothetical protein